MTFKGTKRTFASLLAVGISTVALASCGGGGGGGGSNNNGGGGTLINDDFGSFNTSRWGVYDNSRQLQRTYFGFAPEAMTENGTTFVRLRHDTYNPDRDYAGTFTKGTEFFSRQTFSRGDGLEMTARMRVAPNANGQSPISPGLIFAFFGINVRYVTPVATPISGAPADDGYRQTEIDYELLTADPVYNNGTRHKIWTNVWNDWNFYGYGYESGQPTGYDSNDVPDGAERLHDDKVYQPSVDPNFDWAQWNVYTIRWYPDRTEFYLNGNLERTEAEVKPDEPLSVHVDLWNPNFPPAVDNSTNPVATEAQNKKDFIDVDYIRVQRLGTTANVASAGAPSVSPKNFPRK